MCIAFKIAREGDRGFPGGLGDGLKLVLDNPKSFKLMLTFYNNFFVIAKLQVEPNKTID